MRIRCVRYLWLPLLVLLSGCASHTGVSLLQRPEHPDAPFAFNGRVAIKHDGERSSAGLRWVHTGSADEILLLAPLGQSVARIHSDLQGVTLDASGKRYFAHSAETLTQQVLGWELPLSGLRYWVTALPASESKFNIQRDVNGQITVLHQDGWEINYSRYTGAAADSLPTRFVLRREKLEILILIDEWEKQ